MGFQHRTHRTALLLRREIILSTELFTRRNKRAIASLSRRIERATLRLQVRRLARLEARMKVSQP